MALKSVFLSMVNCSVFFDPISSRNLTKVAFEMYLSEDNVNPRTFVSDAIIDPADSTAIIRQKMIDAIVLKAQSEFAVTLPKEDILLPTYATGLTSPASETRQDIFTAPGVGQTIDTSLRPLSVFSILVTGIGGVPLAWEVAFEGSLNGLAWSEILRHTHLVGTGATIYSGSNRNPSLFIRSRCVSLTLGTAAAIGTTILGVP